MKKSTSISLTEYLNNPKLKESLTQMIVSFEMASAAQNMIGNDPRATITTMSVYRFIEANIESIFTRMSTGRLMNGQSPPAVNAIAQLYFEAL